METSALTLVEQLFELDDHEFRVVTIEDKPWWFVKDVGEYLGYAPKSLVTRLGSEWADELEEGADFRKVEGEELVILKQLVTDSVTRLKGVNSITLLSESGIHTVTMLSRKPQGRKLRRWLAHEVIPSLRKTGSYSISELPDDELTMALEAALRNRRAIHAVETRQEIADDRIKALEDRRIIQPGEMTALQLASRVCWKTLKGGYHNLAVILAAINEEFVDKGLMRNKEREGPGGRTVSEFVFTPEGVAAFLREIDARYGVGDSFTVAPNDHAKANGRKNRCFVRKNGQ